VEVPVSGAVSCCRDAAHVANWQACYAGARQEGCSCNILLLIYLKAGLRGQIEDMVDCGFDHACSLVGYKASYSYGCAGSIKVVQQMLCQQLYCHAACQNSICLSRLLCFSPGCAPICSFKAL
jgi:hypothetical protein